MPCPAEIRSDTPGHVQPRWLVTYVGAPHGSALLALPALGYVFPHGQAVGLDNPEHVLTIMGCSHFRVVDTCPAPTEFASLTEVVKRGLTARLRRAA